MNEKVALEVAIGASLSGMRSLVTMKHVGLNVASDPLMTLTLTGVTAGLVVVVADDPGMHSSQNEQDSRHWSKFGLIPILEPSDSQEAKDFTRLAFEISEEYDTPVILRLVTHLSHTRTPVVIEDVKRVCSALSYTKDMHRYVMAPANAIPRHPLVVKRWKKLRSFSEKFSGNCIEDASERKMGILTDGVVFQYVKEVFADISVIKVGMYPLPLKKIEEFARSVDKLVVVEELDPIIEEEVRAAGIALEGKERIPLCGELS